MKPQLQAITFSWWKFFTGFVLYLFFHEIDRIIPGTLIATLLGESIESIYAHMKMLFYAYMIVCLIDFSMRPKALSLQPFLYSRMLILAAVPWMMIIMWYMLPALGVHFPRPVEITYGIVLTLFGWYFAIRLEDPLESMPMRPALKGMILYAFIAAWVTYISFSFSVPDNFFIAIE
ncbi:MAG: DUF6512 family protein [Anaerolineales bacterium]